jgi:uncharacterized LabA/DUF88 family protein
MIPSAALFIDGSNFYHSLKEQKCLPFDVDGFKDLFSQLSTKYQLNKIYFYDAIKSSEKDPIGYSKQQSFLQRMKNSHANMIIKTRKLRYLVNITPEQIENASREVGIIDSCKDKLWQFLVKLRVLRFTKEKGVDVQLVVDAIEETRLKQVDVIILLSGDADFVPAIRLIKNYGLKTVNLHTYSGSSTELRNACDGHILVDFDKNGLLLR